MVRSLRKLLENLNMNDGTNLALISYVDTNLKSFFERKEKSGNCFLVFKF